MKYLVDANVLSETTKSDPVPRVLTWLRHNESELALDPVILGEIWFGILKLPGGAKRRRLEEWFELVVLRVECLVWNSSTGVRWARLLEDLRRSGRTMPVKDSMIAATALTHGLIVVTRNVRDFRPTGVKLVNPYGDPA